jgi:hypothetical protein
MRRVVHSSRPVFVFALSAALSACSATTSGNAVPAGNPATPLRQTTTTGELLYVGAHRYIETFTYPAGTPVSTITTNFNVIALCSDAHGNVFAPGTQMKNGAVSGAVYEYAHGGTQVVTTLSLPTHQFPVDCSSDPSTGNLAVTSYNTKNFTPQVNVYANASGTPQVYKSSALSAAPEPAYDASGDLYVTSGSNTGAYLAAGSSALVKITSSVILGIVAHAQWDGKYFTVQSFGIVRHQRENTQERIYRFTISGSAATLEGTTFFKNWYVRDAGKSWIAGDTIVATPGASIAIWSYPQGGKATDVLHPAQKGRAVTVSSPS